MSTNSTVGVPVALMKYGSVSFNVELHHNNNQFGAFYQHASQHLITVDYHQLACVI